MWLEAYSFRGIATVEQLQLEHTNTHTQSALPYSSYNYASRHNHTYGTHCQAEFISWHVHLGSIQFRVEFDTNIYIIRGLNGM